MHIYVCMHMYKIVKIYKWGPMYSQFHKATLPSPALPNKAIELDGCSLFWIWGYLKMRCPFSFFKAPKWGPKRAPHFGISSIRVTYNRRLSRFHALFHRNPCKSRSRKEFVLNTNIKKYMCAKRVHIIAHACAAWKLFKK